MKRLDSALSVFLLAVLQLCPSTPDWDFFFLSFFFCGFAEMMVEQLELSKTSKINGKKKRVGNRTSSTSGLAVKTCSFSRVCRPAPDFWLCSTINDDALQVEKSFKVLRDFQLWNIFFFSLTHLLPTFREHGTHQRIIIISYSFVVSAPAPIELNCFWPAETVHRIL